MKKVTAVQLSGVTLKGYIFFTTAIHYGQNTAFIKSKNPFLLFTIFINIELIGMRVRNSYF
jgi:hypothetical protein